jgi:hypothetical protein
MTSGPAELLARQAGIRGWGSTGIKPDPAGLALVAGSDWRWQRPTWSRPVKRRSRAKALL